MAAAATDRRGRGAEAERAAREHLQRAGLDLLDANAHFRFGELDLVMAERGTVVFVEVRYRAPGRFGDGALSVDHRKQRKLVLAARAWLAGHPAVQQRPCRFDVVSIGGDAATPAIDWIRDAFRLDDL